MLTQGQQESLVELINYELKHYPCLTNAECQSSTSMHTKYADREEVKLLLEEVLFRAHVLYNAKFKIKECWFNVVKKEHLYSRTYHTHFCNVVCIYYLKNCTNNGTIVLVDGKRRQLEGKDNTLQFMSGNLDHTIPQVNGPDRYSIAFNLVYAEP